MLQHVVSHHQMLHQECSASPVKILLQKRFFYSTGDLSVQIKLTEKIKKTYRLNGLVHSFEPVCAYNELPDTT